MRTKKRAPTHPGSILASHYLEPLSLTRTDLADLLGVSRKTVSQIVNGRCAITPAIALRLSRVLGTTPQLWLNLQNNYDLWKAAQSAQWDNWKKIIDLLKPVSEPLIKPAIGAVSSPHLLKTVIAKMIESRVKEKKKTENKREAKAG